MLTCMMIGGVIPAIGSYAASLESPFDSAVISSSNGAISSATLKNSETIGYKNEVSYYNVSIKSKGTRKDTAKAAASLMISP